MRGELDVVEELVEAFRIVWVKVEERPLPRNLWSVAARGRDIGRRKVRGSVEVIVELVW